MRTSVFNHFYVQCMCEFSFISSQMFTSVCVFLSQPLEQETQEHTHVVSLSYFLSANDLVCIFVHSQLLNVPVFLPQHGNLVPEQHRVQPHLGVHQGHETQPVTESVRAGLSLSEVVWVCPPRRLGPLGLEKQRWKTERGRG